MNKAELEDEIKKLEFIKEITNDKMLCIQHEYEQVKHDINNFKTQLAKLNKDKTGRVKIGDDLSGFDMCELFVICSVSDVRTLENNEEFDTKEVDDVGFLAAIAQGRTFYDRATAELFALREATEYKIWCEFDDDVAIIFNKWQESDYSHKGVNFDIKTIDSSVSMGTINNFLDTLSEEELNSIRSE